MASQKFPHSDIPGFDPDVVESARRFLQRFGPYLIGLVVLGILSTGFYTIEPGERGVIRRLGKQHHETTAGLHFRIPVIDKLDKVRVELVRRAQIGFVGESESRKEESMMLTGDENIVDVRMVVQYRVIDPNKYLFRLEDPDRTLQQSAEVAIRTLVGRTRIDDVMTTGRGEVQLQTRELLQELMDRYDSGLKITEVKLQNVEPPDEVRDAFHSVTRAREEKEQLINEAKGYRADRLPKARGKVERMLRDAEAYKEERVLKARGDVAKFTAVLEEYKKAKDVTRRRLYLESMERVLGKQREKVIVDEDIAEGSVAVLPLQGLQLPSGAEQSVMTRAAEQAQGQSPSRQGATP